MYELLKSDVSDKTKYELIKNWDKVFSLDLCKEKEISSEMIEYVEEKIAERKVAKENKDYQKADQIRSELLEQGIILKDTKDGTTYELK